VVLPASGCEMMAKVLRLEVMAGAGSAGVSPRPPSFTLDSNLIMRYWSQLHRGCPMLTREMMVAKLDEHLGFEVRDDVEGVLETLSDTVIHDIVGWPQGPSHGPDEARAFYESLFADLAEGCVTTVRRLYGENFLVDESIWSGKAVGRP